MRSVGIDLSSEPSGTGLAVLVGEPGHARLEEVRTRVDDDALLEALAEADSAAIDCPLGWPDDFLTFLAEHRDGCVTRREGKGVDRRRDLSQRATDQHVQRTTGVRPLSVSADRIGAVAMRAADLQAALAGQGRPVDREGSWLVEVCPAAALKGWGLAHQSYKSAAKAESRAVLVAELVERTRPWLDWAGHDATCCASDDALDAVLCAVLARLAAQGGTAPAPAEMRDRASREGWIHLPTEDALHLDGGLVLTR